MRLIQMHSAGMGWYRWLVTILVAFTILKDGTARTADRMILSGGFFWGDAGRSKMHRLAMQ